MNKPGLVIDQSNFISPLLAVVLFPFFCNPHSLKSSHTTGLYPAVVETDEYLDCLLDVPEREWAHCIILCMLTQSTGGSWMYATNMNSNNFLKWAPILTCAILDACDS